MTDIRAHLAFALRGKHPWFAINGHDYDTADVLLSLPGFAVMEPLDDVFMTEDAFGNLRWRCVLGDINRYTDGSIEIDDSRVAGTPDDARTFAAAILAAANYTNKPPGDDDDQ